MSFRLNCKCFYGTWPQCEVTPQQCLDNGLQLLPPVEWAVVAQEAHKDGTPHLHGIFYFKEKCDIKDANAILDLICHKHGNYQGAKSPMKVLRYVCKDGNYVTIGDVPVWKVDAKISCKMAKILLDGGSFDDCVALDAGTAMLQKGKLEQFEAYVKHKKSQENKEVWIPLDLTHFVDASPEFWIANWLNINLFQPRKPRQLQLYIYGEPGLGKSRLVAQISRFARLFVIPRDEDFYDEWNDSNYDLAVLDEFYGNKSVQWLNNWLDGSLMSIRKKGSQSLKARNIPTIILSNYTLEENYRAALERNPRFITALQALNSRLMIINIVNEFNLFE